MSFWKSLFAGASREAEPASGKQIEHSGFVIVAAPVKDGGRFLTGGIIRKAVGGEVREHRFIRADGFGSFEEAEEFSLIKGRQIVDLQGERMFS